MYYRNDLTAEELRSLVEYNPETGNFIWLKRPEANRHDRRWNSRHAGRIAGTKLTIGYWVISINNRKYLGHRLAWLYMTGEWPPHLIDHKNLIRDDNRFSNIRAASHPENHWNMSPDRRNKSKSGYKGVRFHNHSGLWHARMQRQKKEISLGYYKTLEEAAAAHAEAVRRYDGEFAYSA